MIETLHGTHEIVNFHGFHTVRFFRNTETEDYPPHWHAPGEIISPLENTYEVTVSGSPIVLSPGDVLVIAPGELHSIKAPPSGCRYILHYDALCFRQIPSISFLLSLLRPYSLYRADQVPELTSTLRECICAIGKDESSGLPYRDAAVYAHLLQFFVALGRHGHVCEKFTGVARSKQREYTERFIAVCNYINDHCSEDLTLDQISDHAGFSKFHFSRLFKEFTGVTCFDYLNRCRVLYAQGLLTDPSLPVTEVSMRSGFNSLATFNRIFKTFAGCTPSEYRKLGGAPR